jgi:hypothetical protein
MDSHENVEIFKYLGSLVTNTDETDAETKREMLLVINFTTN